MINVDRIISGGQTGVDRAALDFALARRIEAGGWCPKGRKAEDGSIPVYYPLLETHRSDYPYRTLLNIMDSDGTLILFRGQLRGGSALTWRSALQLKLPCLLVDLHGDWNLQDIAHWLEQNAVRILNVAGPRESENRGIHRTALAFLQRLWDA
ncbi:MAG: putative molybdenum carrier protein [Magnetococcus sp. THC-1_WYH]